MIQIYPQRVYSSGTEILDPAAPDPPGAGNGSVLRPGSAEKNEERQGALPATGVPLSQI